MDEPVLDEIYGNRIKLYQPKSGFRVCTDTILLSACITPSEGEKVLDVGAGVGGAALSLAVRCPDAIVHGIELLRENVSLATENVKLNNMQGRVEILCGSLVTPPPRLAAGVYQYVMTNPPYYDSGRQSETEHKKISNHLQSTSLDDWLNFCLLMTKSGGFLTLIYPADQIHKLFRFAADKLGDLKIYPIWTQKNKPAKRVIIRGQKGVKKPTTFLPGLTLHQSSGGAYTLEAEDILRHAKSIHLEA